MQSGQWIYMCVRSSVVGSEPLGEPPLRDDSGRMQDRHVAVLHRAGLRPHNAESRIRAGAGDELHDIPQRMLTYSEKLLRPACLVPAGGAVAARLLSNWRRRTASSGPGCL